MAGYMRKKRHLKSEINVVPYIDVMLVLLVIFMVTSPFITQGVEVDLPQTSESKPAQDMEGETSSFIIVEIDSEGQVGVSVNDEEFTRGLTSAGAIDIVKKARDEEPNAIVAVGGDKSTPYEHIVLMLDDLSQAGVEKVGLLTDIKE